MNPVDVDTSHSDVAPVEIAPVEIAPVGTSPVDVAHLEGEPTETVIRVVEEFVARVNAALDEVEAELASTELRSGSHSAVVADESDVPGPGLAGQDGEGG
ncbi:MAG: hypothetical protein ACT4OS_00760 [Acidimicrobiales bacterium]